MNNFAILKNQIQNYPWGSRTAIAAIIGDPKPSREPQAELWMGAHPKSPSSVCWENEWHSLLELIERFPNEILGAHVASRFQGRLPFLFKILAADQPLSIQAHPNLDQAKDGFVRENAKGIPLKAFHRNYKDDNHKPEIICALTPFWALNGFRPISRILDILDKVGSPHLTPVRERLIKQQDSKGLRESFTALLHLSDEHCQQVVLETVAFAHRHEDQEPLFRWLVRLNELFPGDIGVLCTLFLNLVCLRPGEAMFLPARQLHAYLDGVGIELMANSDNVLRGGLTSKHIDIPELLRVLQFTETKPKRIRPHRTASAERAYSTEASEFCLSKIVVNKTTSYISDQNRSVEILICTRGKAEIINLASKERLQIHKGISVVIPASLSRYQLDGYATLFKASVPNS